MFTIDTAAGGAVYDLLPTAATPLSAPRGLWVDRQGALWIADTGNQVIRKLDAGSNILRVVVGGGQVLEDSLPILAGDARLDRPSSIAGDTAGNVYFSDIGTHRIRRLNPDGQVSTVVGTGEPGFSGDGGPARLARLRSPRALLYDSAGNLYIADSGNCRARRVDTAGIITTFAGNGECGHTGEGVPALNAKIDSPQGLAFDSRGNLFISTPITIRRWDRVTGLITTFAGINSFDCSGIANGIAPTSRGLCNVADLVVDQNDNLYFAHNYGVAVISASNGLLSNFSNPGILGLGLARDNSGGILFTGTDGRAYRATSSSVPATVVAGSAAAFDGPARRAILALPIGAGVDGSGNIYVAEQFGRRVRRLVPATGQMTTVVGGGAAALVEGVLATDVSLGQVSALYVDAPGNIFFALSSVVWKMNASSGRLTRVAGTGAPGNSGDGGPALQANFNFITSILSDSGGNVYLSDLSSNRVRRIDVVSGQISALAGTGQFSSSGDGGAAVQAGLTGPNGLAFDAEGQLLIATGPRLRRVNLSTGIITSIQARPREGAALANVADFPNGVWLDRNGNIFLLGRTKVIMIRAADSVIETVAGGSYEGSVGDGGLATLVSRPG